MNALLLFLAQMLASLGAPIHLTVDGSAPTAMVAPTTGASTTTAFRPTPPTPPAPTVPLLVDRDEATQISNGF